ncbi:MAG: thioredoxin family protein [Rhodobacteraceae bacterium]|nr:thioredoxin family protein [Paracoccaceae bacterium]
MSLYSLVKQATLAAILSIALFGVSRAQTLLIMFEEEGCPYCEQWRAEIGPIYPKTDEGKRAPLVRMDIFEPIPEGINLVADPVYSPTFVLINDGQEIDRLAGYPGQDFFWGLLGRMLSKLPEQDTEGNL